MRRFVISPAMCDFDSRPKLLDQEIQESWGDNIKELHRGNQRKLLAHLCIELGPAEFERKTADLQALGNPPFSIVSYHNDSMRKARFAFVQGCYYPALTAACALGERILNHLILDLREAFKSTPEFSKVRDRSSIDSWQQAIHVLSAWKVLLPEAAAPLRKLESLRNRSLHFNQSTYGKLRDDALSALKLIYATVDTQFTAFGDRPWFIKGAPGACFIRREAENEPFVQTYYTKNCARVGVHHAYSFEGQLWKLFDYRDYEGESRTDKEFCERYNSRDHNKLAPTTFPPGEGIVCYQWHPVVARRGGGEPVQSPA